MDRHDIRYQYDDDPFYPLKSSNGQNFEFVKTEIADMSAIDMLKAIRQDTAPVQCGCRLGCTIWGAYWRNLVNTVEPSVCSGDAALCHILWPLVVICNVCMLTVIPFHCEYNCNTPSFSCIYFTFVSEQCPLILNCICHISLALWQCLSHQISWIVFCSFTSLDEYTSCRFSLLTMFCAWNDE